MTERSDKSFWLNVLVAIALIGAFVWMSQYNDKQREYRRRNAPVSIIDTGDAEQNIRDAEAVREYFYGK